MLGVKYLSAVGATIKGISKVIAVIGKTMILLVGKTIFIFTKSSDKEEIGEATYEKIARFFESFTVGTGDLTGNIIDKIINALTPSFSGSKFKAIHGQMEETFTKEKDSYIKKCKIGESLRLEHEKFSLYKPNSIAIYKGFEHLGYLDEESSKILIPLFNNGYTFKGKIEKVIKGKKGKGYNIKLIVTMLSEP